MKLPLRYLLPLVIGLGVLALLLYSRTNQDIFAEHLRFDHQLDQLGNHDAALDRNVLDARSRLVGDYDGLALEISALKKALAGLSEMPSFMTADGRKSFLPKLAEFEALLAQKEQAVEAFASQNAVLNNSLRFLPTAITDLLAGLGGDEEGQKLEVPMRLLMQQIFVHCLQSSDDEEPAIRKSIEELAQWREVHPAHPQAAAVGRVISHVRSIVRRKPQVEVLTREIAAIPTNRSAEELLRIFQMHVAEALQHADRLRSVLQGICILLLIGIGYTIYALDSANRHLEGRVAARTVELSTENAQRQRAEDELRKSGQFLHSTLDALSAHIAILDHRGNILEVNAAWRKFAEINGGHSGAFGIGTNYLAVCEAATGSCSDEAIQVAAGIRRMMAGEESEFQLEYPCHSPTEERFFIARVTCFHRDDSLHMVVAHENVTDRAVAEQEARTRETELRTLFDVMPAMIWFKDTQNGILRVNKRVAEAVGKPVAEIEGKHSREIYPDDADRIHADDLEVIRSGVPKLGSIEMMRGLDGEEVWVETEKVPYCDKHGNVIGIVIMAQDVTARRRSEEALRESEERFSGAFEQAPIGVALVSLDGHWLKVNHAICELVGYAEAELLSRTFQDITHPEDLETDMGHLRRLIAGEVSAYQMEKRYIHALGHFVSVSLSVSMVRDGQGQPLYFIAQIQDITERKRAEAELVVIHRKLLDTSRQAGMAEVATGVLHNVGNVLNSVNVSATLVSESVGRSKVSSLGRVVELLEAHESDLATFMAGDERGKKLPGYLRQLYQRLCEEQQSVLAEADALRKNVGHIKDIVSMQQQYAKVSGVTEILKVTDLVEDCLRMNADVLARHGVAIERDYLAAPLITIDKHKAVQILVNLIRNANDAFGEGSRADKRLKLRVTNGNGSIKISVNDNGVGIPAENITRIFNHGFTTRKDGHGFGLHSGALAATEMGGRLTVESAGRGHGATFTLELPVGTAKPEASDLLAPGAKSRRTPA